MRLRDAGRFIFRILDLAHSRAAQRPPRSLMFLILIVTHRCNCRCRICDIWKTPEDRLTQELSTGEWMRVIQQASDLNTLAVSITGGEPLLRPDIFDLLGAIREHGMRSHVCSNGTLLTEEAVQRLDEAGLSSISLSLDGPRAELHDAQRGVACFDALVAGVQRLHKRAPHIRIGFNYVLNAQNFRLARMGVELAQDLGASSIRFAPIHTNLQHRSKPAESFEGVQIDASQLDELRRELRELSEFAATGRIHRNSRLFLEWIPASCTRRVPLNCYAGYASCVVDPLGNVAPCPDIATSLNVQERPLTEIWRSEAFHEMRRQVSKCSTRCWDSTYGELALRFTVRSFLRDPLQVFREVGFYLGGKTR